MYLVTVACYRDFYQILIQAESINLFLEPCTHYIIINENKTKLVGRDIAKHIIYRTEFKDFVIILSYNPCDNSYRFNSIKFQNKVFRDL